MKQSAWTASVCLGMAVMVLAAVGAAEPSTQAAPAKDRSWKIKDGRLTVDGQWQFLKIGKPLRDQADPVISDQLIKDLPLLKAKGYNCLEINCYWHHFDPNGDGVPERGTAQLAKLINAIYDQGMIPCFSVETYGVGGGQVPEGFWKAYPDAMAVDSDGREVRDTEYGFNHAVPSLFCPPYRAVVHQFIRNLARAIDTRRILYFETTVEPQYMGARNLDYSKWARAEFETWLKANKIKGPAWPTSFPVPETFRNDPVWNRFRAEFLAQWVNGDAQAYRDVAGPGAAVAVDYLETNLPEMANRNGDSLTFLRHLSGASIIQINWHWHLVTRSPNQAAYDNVRRVMKETGRDWAISEHMTLPGQDFKPEEVPAVLRNALRQGTGFGWDLVNLAANDTDTFALYRNDWSPKPVIAIVDEHWDEWRKEIYGP